MAFEFKLPDLGEGMEEATIVKWLVKEGDTVKKDQNVVEVETDKAIVDVPIPYEGKVLRINFKEGDVAKVGSTLIVVGGSNEKVAVKAERESKTNAAKPVASPHIRRLARELGVDLKSVKGSGTKGRISEDDVRKAAMQKRSAERVIEAGEEMRIIEKEVKQPISVRAIPKARALAKKSGIDLSKVGGTGPGGVITLKDVENAVEHAESIVEVKRIGKKEKVKSIEQKISHPLKPTQAKFLEVRMPIKGIRKRIIEKLSKSNNVAVQTTAMDEVDVSELVVLRSKEKLNADKRGVKLTYLPFIIKACVIALKRHPWLNASLDETTNEFVIKKYYNIGIAVDTTDGLIVPVVKDVELKSILDIAKEVEALADKARERKLSLDELSNGTFTITNWGSIGGGFGTPILNFPQCAILGVGRISKKPVVVGDEIKIRHILPISITFDHRIVDGAEAARFINELKKHLEDPARLLVDMV